MTNVWIIAGEKISHGITENVDTYAGWQRNGYQVKKGSKALFTTSIWKPVAKKNKETGDEYQKLILVKAAFFGLSQVENATNL